MQQGRPPLPPPRTAPPPQPGAAPPAAQQQQPQQPQQLPAAGKPPRVDYETVFTNAKAGMEGVDPEHVKRVVYEASRDSPHYANEQRKDAAVEQKIARMQAAAAAMTAAELEAHTASMDGRLAELEAGRDLTRTWLHVDMDAFFAAVEELAQPRLKGRPFAVGSLSMISTASYAARKFGVRSAMPGFIAVKLCPQLIFVPPDFEKYRLASEVTRAVFRCYDPAFQPGSLDEASLDVTDYCAAHGVSGEVVAAEIRRRVQEETRLTCSVGIAPNRMLAKICSDKNKPNGQYALEPTRDAVLAFMATLSIRKVPGVGKVTQKVLARFGVQTGADLLEQRGLLEALFTPIAVDWFARVALGLGETRHPEPPGEGEVGRKGMSHERTFRPLSRRSELEGKLRELADGLAADMAAEGGLRGKTVTLKLKLSTFELRTRATTLPTYVHTAEELYTVGLRLLRAEMPCELRLLGLRVSNFKEEGKREPGQRSIEEMLQPRQQAQQQQQPSGQGGQEQQAGPSGEPEAGSSGDGGCAEEDGEEEGVHTSQVLSAGELLELSLRDWHPQPAVSRQQEEEEEALDLSLRDWQQPAAGGSRSGQGAAAAAAAAAGGEGWQAGADLSLPASLAVSPASAARYEQEAAAAAAAGDGAEGGSGSGGAAAARPAAGLPLHMPPTGLDVMLQQAAGKLAVLEEAAGQREPQGAQPPARQEQHQQQVQEGAQSSGSQQRQMPQVAPQVWACPACTFENPKSAFWCEVCNTSRIPRRDQPAPATTAAAAGGKTPAGSSKATGKAVGSGSKTSSSGSKGGGQAGSSGKGKRGRKPAALPPPGPSILRFMSAARQTSPPTEQHQQQQEPQAANSERETSPDAQQVQQQGWEQQQQQHLLQADPAGQQQQQQQQQQGEQAQQAAPPPQADAAGEQQADFYEEEWDEEELADLFPDGYEPESPAAPGEDYLECVECLAFIKQSRFQAHKDMHLAERLQQQEEKEHALYTRLTANVRNDSGSGSTPAGGSSKKRDAADKGSKGGGRQATLQAAFAKRAKQQQ